jgi:glyoxylase-like metal-dependent hydrolase (beta-lactamase superfamily II)
MKPYRGPASDHFDGQHFFDPDGIPLQSFAAILRWRITRKPARWPKQAPSNFSNTPPPSVDGNKARLSFVGHASWLLQTAGCNILIDPVWSERCSPFSFAGPKRVNEPGIPFDKLPPIDAVLVSHGHYDHLDLRTLSRLPRVITPFGNDVAMKNFDAAIQAEGYDWGHMRRNRKRRRSPFGANTSLVRTRPI